MDITTHPSSRHFVFKNNSGRVHVVVVLVSTSSRVIVESLARAWTDNNLRGLQANSIMGLTPSAR